MNMKDELRKYIRKEFELAMTINSIEQDEK